MISVRQRWTSALSEDRNPSTVVDWLDSYDAARGV